MNIPAWQRFAGVLLYLLPWSDAIPFGKNLFVEFPPLQLLTLPVLPLVIIERTIPFGGLLLFILIFFAIVRNQKASSFLRFNAFQALLLDIAVVILSYCFQILIFPLGVGLFARTLSNTVAVGVLAAVIFAMVECLQGKEPDLPGISEAVRMQIN